MARGADANRFDDLAASHAAAFASTPAELRAHLQWAGRTVSVRIAGRALARLFRRAVSHLEIGAGEAAPPADVSVYLSEPRDTVAQRVLRQTADALPRAWVAEDLEVRSSACGRMLAFAFGRRATFVLDRENRVLAGVQDAEALHLFERTKPLLLPLRVLLQDCGIHVVHAGLVADGELGALIAGPEGAGKSSTALRCFMAGFDFLGDDQTALAICDEVAIGHSLYGAVQAQPQWLGRLGSFPSPHMDRDASEDKVGLFLAELAPQRLRRSAPIRAVLLPRLGAGRSHVSRAGKADALIRIAPSTLFQPLGAGIDGLRTLQRLVELVPAYWLDVADDGTSIPASVRRALRQAQEQ